ncbi:MAG: SseB family protein [Bdellovibrionales bacterium]|nr:SseB family protein [Bdellovibrionales bacterium]
MSEKSLEQLLDEAERNVLGSAKEFYLRLLESEVLIPLRPGFAKMTEEEAKEIKTLERFAIVDFQQKRILPVFSHKEAFIEWTQQQEIEAIAKSFKSLVWIIGEEIWVHLNPGQEVGKEFSPWEIESLKDGREGVDDLVAELMSEHQAIEIEVDSGSSQFAALKKKIATILEAYPEVTEAFLISFKKDEADDPIPLFGMRQNGLSDKALKTIEQEVRTMTEFSAEAQMPAEFISNIDKRTNPHAVLFDDATPFYIKQQSLPEREEK